MAGWGKHAANRGQSIHHVVQYEVKRRVGLAMFIRGAQYEGWLADRLNP